MKKIYFFLLLALVSFNGFAQLLTEDFNYTGALTSNGWTGHSGVGTNPLSTTTGLTYAGYPGSGIGNAALIGTSGEDVNITFTTQNTNGQDIYYAFLVNVTDPSAAKTGDYFFHTGSPGGATWTSFAGRVFVRIVGGSINFGLSNTSTATYGTTNFAKNTTYLLILKYTINTSGNDPASLWVIPSGVPATEALAGTPEITTTTTAGVDVINAVGLRQGAAANQPQTVLDAIRVGLTWASVTTGSVAPTPTFTATALTAFGPNCTNTTTGPNSFTITGSNLTTANVVVGPLAGYSFSTTSGGTYTPTLALTQTGGSFSQTVYVNFTPTAVQSYNGDIPVSGGGATAILVAASGSGVNSGPTVATGAASAITTNTAVAAGTISATGCSALTQYGIEYSTTSGFATGTGTQVPSTNLSGTAFTSSLSLLTPATTYYYRAYAVNAAGTVYGSELSFTTASLAPSFSNTSLTSFGNVCVNSSSTANSFTITGSNLTSAPVTVGPLAGYSFSTTAGGTYTSSLSLTQPGGSFTQVVYVKLNPTAVQSYNGNIPVSGGGVAATSNVAATGAGVNSAPSVTTGAATSITVSGATLNGTISSIGCSAVTAYGVEYSTVSGFANGTGTQLPSSNLASGSFSSAVSGLNPSTTYYFKAYATNGGGTAYGTEQSFTTAAPPPATLSATTIATFGSSCINLTSNPNSFVLTGSNLTSAAVTIAALNGYTYSTTTGGTYTSTLTLTPTAGSLNQTVFVRFSPTAAQSYNGSIAVSGGGASAINVAATATGLNTQASVTTGAASDVSTRSATIAGSIGAIGCSNVTDAGIELSGIANFTAGNGTKVSAGGMNPNTSFTVNPTDLVPGTTYYYRAYARNAGGTAYGSLQQFVTKAIGEGFSLYPNPVRSGSSLWFSRGGLTQSYAGVQVFNTAGQQVYRRHYNIQNGFINASFVIPASMQPGVYYIRLVNDTEIIETKTILVTK